MLQVGFGRLEITPPLGLPVDGYFRNRSAVGVLDALELNAIAFSDGEHRAVMIAADMLARTLMAPLEIPVGVLTSLIGAPFFFVLIQSRLKKQEAF